MLFILLVKLKCVLKPNFKIKQFHSDRESDAAKNIGVQEHDANVSHLSCLFISVTDPPLSSLIRIFPLHGDFMQIQYE